MSLSLVRRGQICRNIIDDDEDFMAGDDPELCELCNETVKADDHSRSH